MPTKRTAESSCTSRRDFLHTSATLASGLALSRTVHAAGSDTIKLALIGCGGRGAGAAVNALNTRGDVKLVALADAFEDRLESTRQALLAQPCRDRVAVSKDRCFVGLEAYQQAIDCGVDLVLLCTPPGFRPIHFQAAVQAGKHVFMEKPVAVDPAGVRQVLAANAVAKQKGLAIAVGHHLRHEEKHRRIVEQIQNGTIGQLQHLRAYFNSGGVWVRPRLPDESEMHYQVRNWYYFTWLSGDHIVEQHVHDLDVCNWIKGDYPVEAQGVGGRQVRIGKDYGEIFDHHSVEFTYADGTKLFSYCRQIPGCWNSFSQHAHGTRGSADIEGHGTAVLNVPGREPKRWPRKTSGHQVEHDDLFAALLASSPYNEADYGARSSMTAILGRMASYSGQVVRWDDAFNSNISLAPDVLAWNAPPPAQPAVDGLYPCAKPGVTKP